MCQGFSIKINDEPAQEIATIGQLRALIVNHYDNLGLEDTLEDQHYRPEDHHCLCCIDLLTICGAIVNYHIGCMDKIVISGM